MDEELVYAPDTVEFTLVASKAGKEAVQHLDVLRYADVAATEVVFPTMLVGDTLVASGVKSPVRWQDGFLLRIVTSGSGRALTVRHAGREAQLDASGDPSDALTDVPGLPSCPPGGVRVSDRAPRERWLEGSNDRT